MPVRQDTLRRRWLASNNYAASTQRTYTETLIGFERRFPIYVNRVTHEHLGLPRVEGTVGSQAAVAV